MRRILELLDSSSGAIKDILEVEHELARVRGEIEQMEGRVRYLQNRTSLTTVTIHATERRDYVPPQAPSFTSRIQQAWGTSLASLRQFGENLAVCAVFLAPWALLGIVGIAVLLAVVSLLRRRVRRR